jgi:hypothetical protein
MAGVGVWQRCVRHRFHGRTVTWHGCRDNGADPQGQGQDDATGAHEIQAPVRYAPVYSTSARAKSTLSHG